MNDSGMIVLSAKDTQNPIPNEVDAYGNVIEKQSLFLLLPMEDGPKVLAVNSDFDEGRIDPATGYAIPDCDGSPPPRSLVIEGSATFTIETSRMTMNCARQHNTSVRVLRFASGMRRDDCTRNVWTARRQL